MTVDIELEAFFKPPIVAFKNSGSVLGGGRGWNKPETRTGVLAVDGLIPRSLYEREREQRTLVYI